MTNELEKTFFDTFGIEPKCEIRTEHRKHECYGMVDCDECASAIYPQIGDRILLELICIVAKYYCFRWDNWIDEYSSVDKLKKFILLELIELVHQKGIKHQVRTLFEES